MTSQKQTAANIENAQHSTGPRTPEGKAASRQNAVKHGLTGLMRLMREEDHEEYTTHVEGFLETFNPGTPVELHLAQAIADDYWRVERIRRYESRLFRGCDYTGDMPDTKTLTLYALYENRLNRSIKNNTAELRKLQADRLAAEMEVAQPAAGSHDNANFVHCEKPVVNGFVYSTASAAIGTNRQTPNPQPETSPATPENPAVAHAETPAQPLKMTKAA